MRVCCITNDVEATSIYGDPYNHEIAANVRDVALPSVLALYKKYNVRATFFCLASFIQDYPQVVQQIVAEGHEVACHAYVHDGDKAFDVLSYEQQVAHLQQAKTILETASNQTVTAFRAPALRVNADTAKALIATGFTHDSSIASQRMDMLMSFGAKHKLAWLKAPRSPYHVSENNLARRGSAPLTEVPVSAFAIPYISTVMRLSSALTAIVRRLLYWETKGNNSKVVNFLFHPSEAITIQTPLWGGRMRTKNKLKNLFAGKIRAKLKQKNLGVRSLDLLEKELQFWQQKGYQFKTISEI